MIVGECLLHRVATIWGRLAEAASTVHAQQNSVIKGSRRCVWLWEKEGSIGQSTNGGGLCE